MDQNQPAEDPSRLVRFVERQRRLSPERRQAVALAWAVFSTAAIVGALLVLKVALARVRAPLPEPPAPAAAAAAPAPADFPL